MGTPLLATGFGLYEQGVQGQGNAGAFVARAEDGSALYYNPAGLAQLRFDEIALSARTAGSRSFYSNAGQSTYRSKLDAEALPSFFWNKRFERLGVAAGSTVSFEHQLNWQEPDYPGRYLFNKSSYRVYEHMLGLGIKLNESISVGGSLRYAQLEYGLGSTRPRPLDAAQPGLYYEAQETYEGEGSGLGISLGAQYYSSHRFSIGVNYQSGIEIDTDGSRSFLLITRTDDQRAQADFQTAYLGTSTRSTFELPQRLQLGINTRVTVRTRIEADISWDGWSSFDGTRIHTEDAAGQEEEVVIPRDWKDAYSYRIGADFQHRKALLWRMGIASMGSVVPSQTLSTDFPANHQFMYTFGLSLTLKKKYVVEAGWQLIQTRDRVSRDKELIFDPNAPNFVSSTGQQGLFESQRIQIQLGLRVRLGK